MIKDAEFYVYMFQTDIKVEKKSVWIDKNGNKNAIDDCSILKLCVWQ